MIALFFFFSLRCRFFEKFCFLKKNRCATKHVYQVLCYYIIRFGPGRLTCCIVLYLYYLVLEPGHPRDDFPWACWAYNLVGGELAINLGPPLLGGPKLASTYHGGT